MKHWMDKDVLVVLVVVFYWALIFLGAPIVLRLYVLYFGWAWGLV